MNKKAGLAIQWYVLILAFLIGLGVFFYNYSTTTVELPNKFLGQFQFYLIKELQNSENTLFYIDQSAKYAANDAIYDLSNKESYGNSDCGDYLGYPLFTTYDETNNLKECYPDKNTIQEDFKSVFINNLNRYLRNYPYYQARNIRFDINLKQDEKLNIIGIAKDNIEFGKLREDVTSSLAASGKCGFIVSYADQYVGTPYLAEGSTIKLVTPSQAANDGTTCATFVQSVFYYTLGENSQPTTKESAAKTICEDPKMINLETNPDILQPGDIFASESCNSPRYGHTGIYVGKGKVAGKMLGTKHGEFIPDNEGEHIFIHSGTVGY
ncbi:C40 family peptidase, partial [Candidatus Pacearchaeota archaeon]|nr:C40 family peptidase [Candidatus Pacearchaeota archaeon]